MGIEKKVENDEPSDNWRRLRNAGIGVGIYFLVGAGLGALYAQREINHGRSYEEARSSLVKVADKINVVVKGVTKTSVLPGAWIRYQFK